MTGTPEKQPDKSKAELTRERLLSVALEAFETEGFDETSMRKLAQLADLSLGAFYYHFKSKEEIVQVYYEGTFDIFAEGASKIFAQGEHFEDRLGETLKLRVKSFQAHRELLIALSRSAVDPRSSLSPFSEGQKEIREKTVAVFEKMIASSDLKFNKKLSPFLPDLLWMFMMGLVFYWIYDTSPKQRKTFAMIDKLTPLISRLIRFSRLPLTGRVMNPIVDVLETAFGR